MDGHDTLLIVENMDNDLALLQLALQREGIHNPVQVVRDGKEAIDYLCAKESYADRGKYPFPKAIFTELNMPRQNGFELLQWLQRNPECSVIPVIILTSCDLDEDVRRAYQMGANAYLVKPYNLQELQKMVRTAFEFWACCTVPHVPGNC